MAKYTVTCSCGHEDTVSLIGNHRSRESRIDYLQQSGGCAECYEQQRNESRQQATAQATQEAKDAELPDLIGSEKQVAWAVTIRSKLLAEIEEIVTRLKQDKDYQLILLAVDRLQQITEAKQWIDWRDDGGKYLLVVIGRIYRDNIRLV